jgi:hypothetical protein
MSTNENDFNSPRDKNVISKNYETTEGDDEMDRTLSPRIFPKQTVNKSNFKMNFEKIK